MRPVRLVSILPIPTDSLGNLGLPGTGPPCRTIRLSWNTSARSSNGPAQRAARRGRSSRALAGCRWRAHNLPAALSARNPSCDLPADALNELGSRLRSIENLFGSQLRLLLSAIGPELLRGGWLAAQARGRAAAAAGTGRPAARAAAAGADADGGQAVGSAARCPRGCWTAARPIADGLRHRLR